MADAPTNAAASYGEGVKWLVGLSGAAVAGAFLHFDQLSAQHIYIRVLLAVCIALFTFSIWSGVYYLLWLNTLLLREEKKKKAIEELKTEPAEDRRKILEARRKEADEKIEIGESTMPSWHFLYTRSFGLAMLLSGLVLVAALILPNNSAKSQGEVNQVKDQNPIKDRNSTKNQNPSKDQTPQWNHFEIVYSAVHKTAHGREAHTFLLDQSTGDLWQMICAPNNQVVFRHVERDGTAVLSNSRP